MPSKPIENNTTTVPTHICIIPDGNRRWAKSKNLPASMGHKRGVENTESLIEKAHEMGIKYLTGWALSTENWLSRPAEENNFLFGLLKDFFKKQHDYALKKGYRFLHIGRKDRLPEDILEILRTMEEDTKDFTEFTTIIGLDYGGQNELIRMMQKLKEQNLEITEENITNNLDTAGIPDPDFIIRTSGEQRLSGFMPWQSTYAEYYFPEIYFPDFGPNELEQAIEEYKNRNRRFGGN